jgi:MoxR-like ATPase
MAENEMVSDESVWDSEDPVVQAQQARQILQAVRSEVGKTIVGQDQVIEQVLVAISVGGHVLLESVPGLGKTELVKALARSLHLKFGRVQFTPDLMPADILGTNLIVDTPSGGKAFQFQPGPVFAQVLLADEINRATPKTQSALLEAMQERSVTTAGEVRALPAPFFVLATQNPLEQEGTYPLPEAQLDRFFFKVLVPFPSLENLETIVSRTTGDASEQPQAVATGGQLLALRHLVRQIPVAPEVLRHAVRLTRATHPDSPEAPQLIRRFVRYGASPRGAQALVLGARVMALLEGRNHVSFADLHAVIHPALRHRLLLNFEGLAEGLSPDTLLSELVLELPRQEKF